MTVWYTARGAGLSALVLLTVSTVLGAIASGRGRAGARVVLQYVHRVAAALGIGVLVLHIATILADSYANVGVTGAIVPFTSGYRATWVGLGTLSAYALLAVSAIGFARGRMSSSVGAAKIWRTIHCFAYGAWALAIVHGFATGTDSGLLWVRALYATCGLSVVGALAFRFSQPVRRADVLAATPRVLASAGAR